MKIEAALFRNLTAALLLSQELRRKAEEEESPWEWKDAHEKADSEKGTLQPADVSAK